VTAGPPPPADLIWLWVHGLPGRFLVGGSNLMQQVESKMNFFSACPEFFRIVPLGGYPGYLGNMGGNAPMFIVNNLANAKERHKGLLMRALWSPLRPQVMGNTRGLFPPPPRAWG